MYPHKALSILLAAASLAVEAAPARIDGKQSPSVLPVFTHYYRDVSFANTIIMSHLIVYKYCNNPIK
jgi:hypothetical protein